MEMAYSFLRLLNKATKHVYHGDMYQMARQQFQDISKDHGNLQHEWLFRFKEGFSIRGEILRFYRTFFIFSLNHLISPNEFKVDGDDVNYDKAKLVTRAHISENGVIKYILEEIKSSVAVTLTSSLWTEEEAVLYIEQYFVKNLFIGLYKYIMGVYKLYHFDMHFKDLSLLMKKIAVHLHKCTYKGFVKLNEQFPAVKSIQLIKEFLENLKRKFEEFSKVNQLFKIEGEALEEEEISRPAYYKLKRYCVILLSSIENLYMDMGFSRLLIKYRRVAFRAHHDEYENNGLINSHQVEAKFSINLLNYELRAGLIDEKDISFDYIGPVVKKSDIADMFRCKYIESKKKILLLQKSTLMSFMNNSAGHHDCFETFCNFFEKSIEEISVNLFQRNGQIHHFWKDPFYYILLRIWNNMLTESDDTRQIITNKLEWNDYETLEEATSMQKVMTILFKVHIDLSQLTQHKTFFDRNWKELWDVYFNISDIFKNVCEKNNQTCKIFFNKFSPALNVKQKEEADIGDEVSLNLSELKGNLVESELKGKPVEPELKVKPAEDDLAKSQTDNKTKQQDGDSDDDRSHEEEGPPPKEGTFLNFEENGLIT